MNWTLFFVAVSLATVLAQVWINRKMLRLNREVHDLSKQLMENYALLLNLTEENRELRKAMGREPRSYGGFD